MSRKASLEVQPDDLLRNSKDPVFLVNARRKIVFFNRACEELTGMPAGQVLGLECRHHGPFEPGAPASLAGSLCPPPEAFAGQAAAAQVLLIRADGERLWQTVQFLPFAGRDGQTAAVLGQIGPPRPDPPIGSGAEPLSQALQRLRQRLFERYGLDHIVAAGTAMQRVLDQVRLASQTTTPVLLYGEKGTGKEHLARAIHYQSSRRHLGFLPLDCEALPIGILEQHVSAAGSAKDTGAIYLREPAGLPRDLQAQLAEFLQRAAPETGPRLLAGSSTDLRQACGTGTFLEGLYHRLSTLTMELPPLRERAADLPFLVQQVLERCNADGEKQVLGLQPATWEIVRAYAWPGNLVELNATLSAAHRRARGQEISPEDLSMRLRTSVELAQLPGPPNERPLPLDKLLREVERRLIALALRQARGNKSRAANRLEISRARLLRRLQQLGIDLANKDGGDQELVSLEEGEATPSPEA